MKFSAGRPKLHEMRTHIASEWHLAAPPAVGLMDPRHVTLHMASAADTQRALSRPTSKIKNYLFRLFRWTPDFEIGKDSSMAAMWARLYNLPLQYFNESALIRLGSALGTVLLICPKTADLTQQIYARMCIELEVSKPLLESFLSGTSNEDNWPVFVEYEGNNAYCSHCGLLGHVVGICRKKHPQLTKENNEKGKIPSKKGKEKAHRLVKPPVSILKRGESNHILKEMGLVSSSNSSESRNNNDGPGGVQSKDGTLKKDTPINLNMDNKQVTDNSPQDKPQTDQHAIQLENMERELTKDKNHISSAQDQREHEHIHHGGTSKSVAFVTTTDPCNKLEKEANNEDIPVSNKF